ncbi:MAG: CBS domain-containing protein, partial [candidate division Zixibacteria bacterium]|nr:CBS domain-containing protein [candidate division Zixibacteria bacterium]
MAELISIIVWAVYTYVTYLVTVFSVSVYIDPDQIDELLPNAKESHRKLLVYLSETPLAFTHAANLFKWVAFSLVAALSYVIGPDLAVVTNLPTYLSFGICLLVLTAITFLVIEILPRRKSLQRLDSRFFRLIPALRVVFTLSKAYVRFQQRALARQGTSSRLSSELKEEIVERAIESLADQVGASEKLIAEVEGEMIEGVLQLSSMEAQEVMTPRVDLVAFEIKTPLAEVRKISRTHGHSRYPIYEESLDKIVGVLYIKDIFINPPTDPERFSIADYMRKPYFIPSRIKTSELFKDFKAKKVHAAIVVDEFGGAAGFVTLEDILEEIVG